MNQDLIKSVQESAKHLTDVIANLDIQKGDILKGVSQITDLVKQKQYTDKLNALLADLESKKADLDKALNDLNLAKSKMS